MAWPGCAHRRQGACAAGSAGMYRPQPAAHRWPHLELCPRQSCGPSTKTATAAYCGEAVQLWVEGPVKLLGPVSYPCGRHGGHYLATTGAAGRAVLHCRMEGALDTELHPDRAQPPGLNFVLEFCPFMIDLHSVQSFIMDGKRYYKVCKNARGRPTKARPLFLKPASRPKK